MGVVSVVLSCAVAALCFWCVYHDGVDHGRGEGFGDGYLHAIRDLCEGHMSVDGDKLIFDEETARFYDKDKGEFITELEMSKINFEEC